MEGFMDPLAGIVGARRNEDIALDLMKFIAATTNFGKTVASGAGFHGGVENKSEDNQGSRNARLARFLCEPAELHNALADCRYPADHMGPYNALLQREKRQ